MIKLADNGFVVHFTSVQPATDYVETLRDLVTLLQDRDPETSEKGSFYACELLRQMLPNEEQARLIFESDKITFEPE